MLTLPIDNNIKKRKIYNLYKYELLINIGNKYNLVTPTQDTFVLIIVQFALILLINQYYLKQDIFRSDIVAFFLVLLGLFISFFKLVSGGLTKATAFTKVKAYHELIAKLI